MKPWVGRGKAGIDGRLLQHFFQIARLEFVFQTSATVHSEFLPTAQSCHGGKQNSRRVRESSVGRLQLVPHA